MSEMNRRDRLLILLALRAKFKCLEPSIADYHRDFNRMFDEGLCYHTVRNRLRKLEGLGILKSELVRGFARNDLVDSRGVVKLARFSKVYKKVYSVNEESRILKQFIKGLKELSKQLFGKGLSKVLCNDEFFKSLI